MNADRVLYKVDKAAAASKPVKDRPHAYEEVEVFLPRDGTTPTKGPMLEKMVDPHVAKVRKYSPSASLWLQLKCVKMKL